jgi:hypothetical protein
VNKRAQVTIFVIIAIVIVVGTLVVYIFKDDIFSKSQGHEFGEIYENFENCIEQRTIHGLGILGIQGGYIETPDFKPGSEYAPFSSQLDFLGVPVPYWYYVSGNGIVKEQVPSMSRIENQLEDFLEKELDTCEFSIFREQGNIIDYEVGNVDVRISNNKVNVNVGTNFNVQKGSSRERKSNFEVEVNSQFGALYNDAVKFYEKEKQSAMIENYTLDVLFNYAPVVGSEINCAPEVWNPREVVNELRDGLSGNIGALKVKNNNYELNHKENEYFVMDFRSDFDVNFLYDKNWPTRIEIWGVEDEFMIAEPVGMQEGLGILGFCYVPYNFVYDIYHPVLVQFSSRDEMLQFPLAIVIDKNNPRNSLAPTNLEESSELNNFCDYKNTDFSVYTYDSNFNPIEADVDFKCFNERCNIGKTSMSGSEAVLKEQFPQCVNGVVRASAEDYVSSEKIISTNKVGSVDLVLSKLYELDLDVRLGGRELGNEDLVVIRFEGFEHKATVAYPQQDKIKLSEDIYNVSVQIFSKGSFTIPETTSRNCMDVPRSGIFNSLIGRTEEQCFEVKMPSQEISNSLVGGGDNVFFILQSELEDNGKLVIDSGSLPRPNTLDDLQRNYQLIESNSLEVYLR